MFILYAYDNYLTIVGRGTLPLLGPFSGPINFTLPLLLLGGIPSQLPLRISFRIVHSLNHIKCLV